MKHNENAPRGMGAQTRVGSIAAALLACAAFAACGNGGLEGGEDPQGPSGPGGTASSLYTVIPQSTTPRVDLPGRVTTFVQVVDSLGRPVPNLPESQFALYENGGPVSATESGQRIRRDPQTFRTYSHLLIDRSNSVTGREADIKAGARAYVATLMGETPIPDPNDPTAPPIGYENPDPDLVATTFIRISWFDGSPTIHPIAGATPGFINDVAGLENAIDLLFGEPPFNGSTNLYGAVLGGLDALDEEDNAAAQLGIQNRTLTLVTFTDGTHQAGNGVTLAEVEMRLATEVDGRNKYNAFSIGVGNEIDVSVLDAIGPQGRASDLNNLLGAFETVIGEVSNLANSFYALAYCSPKLSGTHDLEIGAATAAISQPSPSSGALPFVADGFGAGCAFLDARAYPQLSGGFDDIEFSAALEDGEERILAVGWRSNGCAEPGCTTASEAFLVRFRPDGSVDTSLSPSTGGLVELEPGPFGSGATSIVSLGVVNPPPSTPPGQAQDPYLRIVAGGWQTSSGMPEAKIWDVHIDLASGEPINYPFDIALNFPQTAGASVIWDLVFEDAVTLPRLYCAGSIDMPTQRAAVWSLLPTSNFDPDGNWPTGGLFVDPAPLGEESRVARAIDLLGNIGVVVAGDGPTAFPSTVNEGRDLTVLSIDPADGQLDASFGTNGRVVATSAFMSQQGGPVFPGLASDLAVDPFGRIVVAGTVFATSGGGPTQQPAAWRLMPNGAVDSVSFRGSPSSVFPNSGVVTLRTGSTQDPNVDFGRPTQAHAMHIGAGGEVLLVGARDNVQSHRDMALVSFRESGAPDTYNTVGFVIEDGASGDDSDDVGQVVLRHSNGTVWVLGASRPAGATADVPVVWLDGEHGGLFGGN